MSAGGLPEARILIFAKAPVAGEVKTRLIELLGAEGAKELYEKLLLRTVETACATGAKVQLWCAPNKKHTFFAAMARTNSIELREQPAGDLGDKMLYAARDALRAGAHPIIVGADCPELQPADLHQAITALSAGYDAVLGPARDGGFYLLGLRTTEAWLFRGIAWGTDTVLEEARSRFRELSWRWKELPTRFDIDRAEDYAEWIAAGRSQDTSSSAVR
jgi:rSAM/selenodomain-associated transferase 1